VTKITILQSAETATLKLEGRVIGPWVKEFQEAWRSLSESLGSKHLLVDLSGVTYMDAEARDLLAEIHSETGADFLADSPMTKYFVEQARRGTKALQEGD
jgi:anti-anti-sigma regulatory factor